MNLTDKISKHLTYHDVIKSEYATRNGIVNSLPIALQQNAKFWAVNVFDKIKDHFPEAGVYSFYRSAALNKGVGGSPASFHSFAGAGDIDTPANFYNKAIFKWVLDGNVPFNEVIWEFGTLDAPDWVHVGLLPGYTTHNILHIYHEDDIKKRDVLTKEKAYELFKL